MVLQQSQIDCEHAAVIWIDTAFGFVHRSKEIKTKVCLVGDNNVGKTSLIRRFVLDSFDDKYTSTIGTKVTKKEVNVKRDNGREVSLSMLVWDIMGQKGFRELLRESYFYG